MENYGIAPSVIRTEEELLAQVSMIYGAMHQYLNGDPDLRLLVLVAKRFQELEHTSANVATISPRNLLEFKKKINYIGNGLKAARRGTLINLAASEHYPADH